jgi:hypothetical protein
VIAPAWSAPSITVASSQRTPAALEKLVSAVSRSWWGVRPYVLCPKPLHAAGCAPWSTPGAWSAGGLRVAGGELGVDALGFGELVFQNDDVAGGVQRVALVDELTGAGGQPQLIAGVASVPAG